MWRSLVLAGLLACSLHAQTVSPVEPMYGPYRQPRFGAAPAIAVSRTGILFAWSETDRATGSARVKYALLDAPLAASDGESFLLTISATPRRETDPHPAVLPNGFLVVYASDDDGDHRLAGRVVVTARPRRRAVR